MIKKKIKNWMKSSWDYQWSDMSGVIPRQQWSEKDRAFFLNSSAGLIKYKPKNDKDLQRFRDKYVNQFDVIMMCPNDGLKEKMFFLLYQEIKKNERVKYKGNIRTRLRGKFWSFASLF